MDSIISFLLNSHFFSLMFVVKIANKLSKDFFELSHFTFHTISCSFLLFWMTLAQSFIVWGELWFNIWDAVGFNFSLSLLCFEPLFSIPLLSLMRSSNKHYKKISWSVNLFTELYLLSFFQIKDFDLKSSVPNHLKLYFEQFLASSDCLCSPQD